MTKKTPKKATDVEEPEAAVAVRMTLNSSVVPALVVLEADSDDGLARIREVAACEIPERAEIHWSVFKALAEPMPGTPLSDLVTKGEFRTVLPLAVAAVLWGR